MKIHNRTFNSLKAEFDKAVKKLQAECPHTKSKWMGEWWAYAHSTGDQVKVCDRCHKILDRKKDER